MCVIVALRCAPTASSTTRASGPKSRSVSPACSFAATQLSHVPQRSPKLGTSSKNSSSAARRQRTVSIAKRRRALRLCSVAALASAPSSFV